MVNKVKSNIKDSQEENLLTLHNVCAGLLLLLKQYGMVITVGISFATETVPCQTPNCCRPQSAADNDV